MKASTRYDEIARLAADLVKAERRSLDMAAKRSALPPGSTRARVTTANANWASAAEQRDRVAVRLREAVDAANL